MKYFCAGHDRHTAISDMLICLFPDEKHEEGTGGGDRCVSTLEDCGSYVKAKAEIYREGNVYFGECEEMAGESAAERKRAVSYAVKTALFKAALHILPAAPAWGSLTGVKPAKPARAYMAQGHTKEETAGWLKSRYYVTDSRAKLCAEAAEAALDTERDLGANEVQIYVGIPFCPSKCAYCSFVSNDIKGWGHLISPYFDALLSEIKAAGQMLKNNKLKAGSVYIGGGTPTVLSDKQLDTLISCIEDNVDLSICREFTVEAGRPDTVTAQKLSVFKEHRISRISINPQTMKDEVLINIGRKHTVDDIKRAYYDARSTGDFIINCDLIAGLPGDDGAGVLQSVKEVIELAPENITLHCMARKKGAPLRFGDRGSITENELDACAKELNAAGYAPYYLYRQKYSAGGLENTGFCKNGLKSHYNICMMEEIGNVIALGSGGISKIYPDKEGKIIRVCNPKYPLEYIERIETIKEDKLKITF